MKKLLLLLILVLLVAGGILAYSKYFTRPSLKVLETSKVERGDIKGVLVETGVVKPQVGAVVKIGTRATGAIMKMSVKIGDRVKRGDLVALIDDREVQKVFEQAGAALIAAQNTLRQVELTYPKRIAEARANYDYAQINYDRERELLIREYTTKDSVDRAKSQLDSAEAILRRLEDEYATQLKISRANMEDREAQLKQQETRLSYTRIYSPIDGIVSDVTTQEGETIVAGLQVANLVTVLDPSSLEMWIYIDETDIGKVKVSQGLEYYVDTYPSRVFSGAIEKIYPQPAVKDNIVYYLATVRVSKKDAGFLRPEMTTHVKIIFDEKKNILIAPNAAIKYEKGRQIAYKVKGQDMVSKTEIKTGIRGEDRTEILSGVNEGDVLATKLIIPADKK